MRLCSSLASAGLACRLASARWENAGWVESGETRGVRAVGLGALVD